MTRDGRDTLIKSLAHQEGVRNTYEICADDGALVALHVRIQSPGQKKRFVWQQPDGSSGLHVRSVSELPLYGTERLPGLKSGRLVVVTEGEKAADALRRAHSFRLSLWPCTLECEKARFNLFGGNRSIF